MSKKPQLILNLMQLFTFTYLKKKNKFEWITKIDYTFLKYSHKTLEFQPIFNFLVKKKSNYFMWILNT